MQLTVKKEFDYSHKVRTWKANPFVIAFVYPAQGKAYIVKGDRIRVRQWIENNEPNCLVWWETYIHNPYVKSSYTAYSLFVEGARCHCGHNSVQKYGRHVRKGSYIHATEIQTGETFYKTMRRMPRCFPRELKKFVKSV